MNKTSESCFKRLKILFQCGIYASLRLPVAVGGNVLVSSYRIRTTCCFSVIFSNFFFLLTHSIYIMTCATHGNWK